MGKFLIITGIVLVIAGLAIQFSGRIPFFGKLPGDIHIQRGNFSFYFPVVTSILLSIIISLILYFLNKGRS
ncbi:MAG TPA: DUF2905 domain-containing protein [Chryseosolibacter sp.]